MLSETLRVCFDCHCRARTLKRSCDSKDQQLGVRGKKIEEYENGPEGKKALLTKAKKLEADRDEAKLRSPWIGYANTAYQLAIVILSASILAVSMPMFYGSVVVGAIASILLSQGIWLWF